MDGRDCAKCQKSRQNETSGINEKVNENKTKLEIVVFSIFESKTGRNRQWGWIHIFRERRCAFSLDFRQFGPSVLDEARSKVVLRGKGYEWTPIWWSSDKSKR